MSILLVVVDGHVVDDDVVRAQNVDPMLLRLQQVVVVADVVEDIAVQCNNVVVVDVFVDHVVSCRCSTCSCRGTCG